MLQRNVSFFEKPSSVTRHNPQANRMTHLDCDIAGSVLEQPDFRENGCPFFIVVMHIGILNKGVLRGIN